MSTAGLFQRLRNLLPQPQVLVGIVVEIHDDDTSTVRLPGPAQTDYAGNVATGSLIRPRGTTVPAGKNAFVRAGVIETQAPDGVPIPIVVGKVVLPPAPAPAPTPAPPPAPGLTLVFQDTFTGADGTELSLHTPDMGSAWVRSAYSVSQGDTMALVSNMAGGAALNDTPDYFVPITFGDTYRVIAYLKAPATCEVARTDAYFYTCAVAGGDSTASHAVVFSGMSPGGAQDQYVSLETGLYGSTRSPFSYTDSPAAFALGSTTKLEMRVTPTSTELYVNDVLATSDSPASPGPDPTHLGIYFASPSISLANQLRLASVEVYAVAP